MTPDFNGDGWNDLCLAQNFPDATGDRSGQWGLGMFC